MTILKGVTTFNEDGRKSFNELYEAYSRLESEFGLVAEGVYRQEVKLIDGKVVSLPVMAFRTKNHGKAVWLLSGIHGEEPAGPNAISNNIDFLGKLSQRVPMVIVPLCNPSGYVRDYRYPGGKTLGQGESVGDSEHYLLNKEGDGPIREKAVCLEAAALTAYVLEKVKEYPPLFVVDLHEDKVAEGIAKHSYVYLDRRDGLSELMGEEVKKILEEAGLPTVKTGKTAFDEPVIDGIVCDESGGTMGSVDELFTAKKIWVDGSIVDGPGVVGGLVVETPVLGVPLEKRVRAQEGVIRVMSKFLEFKD